VKIIFCGLSFEIWYRELNTRLGDFRKYSSPLKNFCQTNFQELFQEEGSKEHLNILEGLWGLMITKGNKQKRQDQILILPFTFLNQIKY